MALYRIIALGDSLTYGFPFGQAMSWVAYTAQELKIPILNQGVNGDTLQQMLRRMTIDVIDFKPEYCVIMGGINDVYQGVSFDSMQSSFVKITEALLDNKILPIIGLATPFADRVYEKHLAKFRLWLKKHARAYSLRVIDFHKTFLDPKKKRLIRSYLEDGVHPSAEGYKAMAQEAVKVLRPLLESGN